jgi:hypothetical protein
MDFYFDFRTYFKIIRLVITDKPNPKRLVIHSMLLFVLSGWALNNAICMQLDRIFFPGYRKTQVKQPVFIVGNARSGTTLFHRLLSGDEERFVCFKGWEIFFPAIIQKKALRQLARIFPKLFQWLSEWEERQYQEVRRIRPGGLNEPEEDEFLMLTSFASTVTCTIFPYSVELGEAATFNERPEKNQKRIMQFYRECVLRQLYFHGGDRTLVSKNPAFVPKMQGLAQEFPDSKLIYLMRNPFETIPSLLKLMSTLWEQIGIESDHIDRSIRELAEGSVRDYHFAMKVLSELPDERYAIIEYTDLVADLKATVEQVYDRLNLSMSPEFEQKLSTECSRQKKFQSSNVYSLEEFGISESELSQGLADIIDQFGYRSKDVPDNVTQELL